MTTPQSDIARIQPPRGQVRRVPWKDVARALVLALAAVWAVWVTKALVTRPEPSVVKLNLAGLVQEYMVAASHSNWTPDQIRRETAMFTDAIDGQIAAYSVRGKTVLMTEAVLSRSVPDITPDVRAMILKKVAWPSPGTVGVISPLVPHGADMPLDGNPQPTGGADGRP